MQHPHATFDVANAKLLALPGHGPSSSLLQLTQLLPLNTLAAAADRVLVIWWGLTLAAKEVQQYGIARSSDVTQV